MLSMFGVSLFTQFSAHWGRVVCHGYWCLVAPAPSSPCLSLPSCFSLQSLLLARNLLAVPSKRRRTVYQDRDWNRSDVSHQLAARRLQLDKCDCSTPLYPFTSSPLYLPTLDHWTMQGRKRNCCSSLACPHHYHRADHRLEISSSTSSSLPSATTLFLRHVLQWRSKELS